MQTVIIAGGRGTRLGLEDIPKPMVEINGKPLLQYQIELAKKYGCKDIFILSGFLSDKIEQFFGSGEKFGVNIHYEAEKEPLGTAGCLKLIENKLHDRFLVFYGDIFIDFDLKSFIDFDKKQGNSIGTLISHPNSHPYDSDLLEVDGNNKISKILFKPHEDGLYYRNSGIAGIYLFSKKIFKYIENNKKQDLVKDVIKKALNAGEYLYSYKTPEYIKDIGTKERLDVVKNDLLLGKPQKLHKSNKRPCIFLDRDGTINENMGDKPLAKDFKLLEGVKEAVHLINKSGYLCVVVTNQPMAAKGFITIDEIEMTHKKMEMLLAQKDSEGAYLDAIYYCPHHNEKGFVGEVKELKIDCDCRKPKAGMLFQAAKDLNIDLTKSFIIGDSERDLLAGKNAGCKTVYLSDKKSDYADFYAQNLFDAVKIVLGKN